MNVLPCNQNNAVILTKKMTAINIINAKRNYKIMIYTIKEINKFFKSRVFFINSLPCMLTAFHCFALHCIVNCKAKLYINDMIIWDIK